MSNYDFINNEINKISFLSSEQKKFFVLYNDLMNSAKFISKEEKKFLAKFISDLINDKSSNSLVLNLDSNLKNVGISEFPYLDVLKGFSFEIRHKPYIDNLLLKAHKALYLISKDIEPSENDKLSISELGLLRKFKKIERYLDIFEERELNLGHFTFFKEIYNHCNLLKKLDSEINKLISPTDFMSGDIIASDCNKTEAYILSQFNGSLFNYKYIFNRAKQLVEKYGHSSILLSKDSSLKQSHLWSIHKIEDANYGTLISSDIYRINLSKLVSNELKPKLQEILGDEWHKKLQILFAEKTEEISKSPILKQLKIIEGLASTKALLPHWFGHNKEQNIGLFVDNNEKTLVENELICSDFIARSLVEGIREVNKELYKIDNSLVESIKMPFDSYVTPGRITPTELINLLNKAKCIDTVKVNNLDKLVKNNYSHEELSIVHLCFIEDLYRDIYDTKWKSSSYEEFSSKVKVVFSSYIYANMHLRDNRDYKKAIKKANIKLDSLLPELYKTTESSSFIDMISNFISYILNLIGFKDKEINQLIDSVIKDCSTEDNYNQEINSENIIKNPTMA